jgi:hypothetical protein
MIAMVNGAAALGPMVHDRSVTVAATATSRFKRPPEHAGTSTGPGRASKTWDTGEAGGRGHPVSTANALANQNQAASGSCIQARWTSRSAALTAARASAAETGTGAYSALFLSGRRRRSWAAACFPTSPRPGHGRRPACARLAIPTRSSQRRWHPRRRFRHEGVACRGNIAMQAERILGGAEEFRRLWPGRRTPVSW